MSKFFYFFKSDFKFTNLDFNSVIYKFILGYDQQYHTQLVYTNHFALFTAIIFCLGWFMSPHNRMYCAMLVIKAELNKLNT